MRGDMEQRRKWMWAARNLTEKLAHGSQIQASVYAYESWEEKAFAEDSAAHLGGCVWPPRSYPCSFCKREFRSAQALGGHMNVHRRDRARLKQSLNPVDDDRADSADDHPQIHSSSSSKPCASLAPPDLSPRVSVASTRQYALFSPPCRSSVSVLLELVPADQPLVSQGLKLGSENSSPSNRNMDHDDDEVEEDGEEGEEEEEENIGIKRRRTTEINFSTRISSGAIREKVQSDQVLKQSPWPVEELDLELRLGQKRKLAVMVGL